MPRRVELNPGEPFLVADRMILVDEWESILGDVSKIGSAESRVAYLFTFTGKVNNRDERDQVTVALDVESAWSLVGQILHGLELLKEANSPQNPTKQGEPDA